MQDNDADHLPADTASTAAEAFALVGHELRAEIIRVLGDADGLELSLSELRSRLGSAVEPSQLHYHLQQLLGHFVTKTDGGYRLSAAGIRLCLTLHAGTFDHQQQQPAVEVGTDCYHCQAPVEAVFREEGVVGIACPECGHGYGGVFLETPRGAFRDESGSFSISHFRKYMALKYLSIARGVCPMCANPLRTSFHDGDEHPGDVCIHESCDCCRVIWDMSVGRALLADPGLRSFCHEYGVDVLSTPYWELEFAATDKYVTVRSTDPWEVALEVTFDDDTLELVVDGDLNIVERNRLNAATNRSPSSAPSGRSDGDTSDSTAGETAAVLPDGRVCLQSLRRHRWPDEVRCPDCESTDTKKDGTTSKDAQRYKCHTCNRIFNDLSGTIFAQRRLTLPEMFLIIRALDADRTPATIARHLDRSYKSVLDFVHVVRDARSTESAVDLAEVVPPTGTA